MTRHDPEPDDKPTLETGRIEIVSYLTEEGEEHFSFVAEEPDGTRMPLVKLLGFLELAKDGAIRTWMGDEND